MAWKDVICWEGFDRIGTGLVQLRNLPEGTRKTTETFICTGVSPRFDPGVFRIQVSTVTAEDYFEVNTEYAIEK
jgi:hypothetical protein